MSNNLTHKPETSKELSVIYLLRKWEMEGKSAEEKAEIFKCTHRAIMEILEEAKTNKS